MSLLQRFACALTIALSAASAQAIPFKIAVLQGTNGSDSAAAVASQLNDSTQFSFAATVYQGNATPPSLSAFDAVVLGGSGYSNSEYSSGLLSSVQTYLNGGGGVITTGWYRYAEISAPNGAADAISPIQVNGDYGYSSSNSLHIINNGHPITTGVSDIFVSGCCIETGSPDIGATVLGTVSDSTDGSTGLAYQDAVGRSAYIGLLYFADPSYNNTGLRIGDADRLLEQTVAWAANSTNTPSNVPEPASIALLSLGLLGFAASRRKSAK